MLGAFVRAIAQLGDPSIRRVIWLGLGGSLLLFVLLWTGVGWVLTHTTLFETGWLNMVTEVLGGLATLVVSWLLFPAVVSTTTGLLLDDVAESVERRHYPNLPPPRSQPLAEMIGSTLQFLVILLALNLGALLFLAVPPVFPFVFYGINGYLLGREYFEIVAARRLDARSARTLRQRNAGTVFVAGLILALLLTVPIVNLVTPLVGTAVMVHLVVRMQRTS